jgi:hypothetical protein
MGIRMMFAAVVEAKCDWECMATQDAVDRLLTQVSAGRNRTEALAHMRNRVLYTTMDFYWSLTYMTPSDVQLVTGHSRDWWLAVHDKNSRARA